jgi:hypothetical protein
MLLTISMVMSCFRSSAPPISPVVVSAKRVLRADASRRYGRDAAGEKVLAVDVNLRRARQQWRVDGIGELNEAVYVLRFTRYGDVACARRQFLVEQRD